MNITVAGTGYVGLVTGVCLAELGHQVTGIDIQEEKIAMLQSAVLRFTSLGYNHYLKKMWVMADCILQQTHKYAYGNAEIIFIAVGTPEQQDGTANLDTYMTSLKRLLSS